MAARTKKMNQKWIETLFRKLNPEYRYRCEVYEERLCDFITNEPVWLDIGCGKNEHVAKFGYMAKTAYGIDRLDYDDRIEAPFIQADLHSIPLPSSCVNLITLRLVVEHMERIPDDLCEICRLLVPGGRLILLTTNSLSPVVLLPRLLPFRLKSWLIQKIFGVTSYEVFPTYHRFNTPMKMQKGLPNMKLSSLEFLEQVPLEKPLLTFIFGLWYSLVKFSPLRLFRSNLLAIFQKTLIE